MCALLNTKKEENSERILKDSESQGLIYFVGNSPSRASEEYIMYYQERTEKLFGISTVRGILETLERKKLVMYIGSVDIDQRNNIGKCLFPFSTARAGNLCCNNQRENIPDFIHHKHLYMLLL